MDATNSILKNHRNSMAFIKINKQTYIVGTERQGFVIESFQKFSF